MARIVFVAVIMVLLVSCGGNNHSQSLGDGDIHLGTGTAFGNAWNANCEACNFESNVDVTTMTTLGDMHFGEEFEYDIACLGLKISLELGRYCGLSDAGFQALYIYYDDLIDND